MTKQSRLRQRILALRERTELSPGERTRLVQQLMMERWTNANAASRNDESNACMSEMIATYTVRWGNHDGCARGTYPFWNRMCPRALWDASTTIGRCGWWLHAATKCIPVDGVTTNAAIMAPSTASRFAKWFVCTAARVSRSTRHVPHPTAPATSVVSQNISASNVSRTY